MRIHHIISSLRNLSLRIVHDRKRNLAIYAMCDLTTIAIMLILYSVAYLKKNFGGGGPTFFLNYNIIQVLVIKNSR